MTIIVTVQCPDQSVKVLVRESYNYPVSDAATWVYPNEKATFTAHNEKRLYIEEWPIDKRPTDRTDLRLEQRLKDAT